jgi:N-acetylmuramoyl-L-alanine amidase
MRPLPSAVLLSLLTALPFAAASATDLRGVRLMENDEGTRAVVELTGPTDYKFFTLHNPDRLVLDLRGAALASAYGAPPVNGVVTNVRTGQPTPDTLRVVFDLGDAVDAQAHIEGSGTQTRLVLDLVSPNAPAPSRPAVRAPDTQIAAIIAPPPVVSTVATVPVAVAEATPAEQPVVRSAPAKTIKDVIGSGQRKLVVAIDAGHGGKDPGAHGPSGLREKDVTLAVAKELARQINADPGMKAVLIRDDDSFVVLQNRYQRARTAQADLFISIHADAAQNSAANGASVFVLSTRGASSQAARWLADQENAADLVGGVALDGKDHNLASVLLDLSQSATMRASDDVAGQVLASLQNVGKAHKKTVERANFVVLRSPDVPSMLVETGFITNPGEEKNLGDQDYRRRLANAIASGVRQYFTDQPPPGTWYAARQSGYDTPRMVAVSDVRRSTTSASGGLDSRQHVVSRGETLTLIAAQHGVPIDTLRTVNRKHNDRVRVGERLRIPLIAAAPQ